LAAHMKRESTTRKERPAPNAPSGQAGIAGRWNGFTERKINRGWLWLART
jgi:hypothetical protein